jgi:hypothetical protein
MISGVNWCFVKHFAEEEGFEPPDLLQSTVFKTAAIDHSAIPPVSCNRSLIADANITTFFSFPKTISRKNTGYFPTVRSG